MLYAQYMQLKYLVYLSQFLHKHLVSTRCKSLLYTGFKHAGEVICLEQQEAK